MQKSILITLILVALSALLVSVPRNLVVVEIGTGTWCPYCPGAAMGADDLIANGQPVAIIENHNGDTYANTYSNARNSYYGITGYPTAFFDGLNPSVGGSSSQSMYSNYLPKVTSRMAVPSKYTIAATGSLNNNVFDISVGVAKPEADTNTNVVLQVVLTESEIAQNWQGQTHLNFVTRLMVPSQNGTPINLGTGETTTVPLSFTWDPAWNMAHGEIVLFLQNYTTKEILQGIKYSLPGLVGAYPISHTELDFPDTYLTGTSTIPISIINFTGNAASGTISSTNPAFTISSPNFNIPAFQSGIVDIMFTPTAGQQYSGMLNINSNLHQHNQIEIPLSGLGFVNTAPVANDVMISGPPVVFQDLTASYAFYDADGNTEGTTTFQWMRIMNNNPTPIDGAVYYIYRTIEEDMGWRLAVQITPRDQHGMPGTPVMSDYTQLIEELPAPQNFNAVLTPPSTVVLTWEKPEHFNNRGFVGYRIYRDGLAIQSIANTETLTFTDTYVPLGERQYWVCSLFNNPMMISAPSNVVTLYVGVSNDDNVLSINESINVYPNPFSKSTSFQISTKINESFGIEIYNLKGQLVHTLKGTTDNSGKAEIQWDGSDRNAKKFHTGMYIYRMKTNDKVLSGKLLLQ